MKKRTRLIAAMIAVILATVSFASAFDNKKVEAKSISATKLKKKLVANYWSAEPNPNSKELTLGYALAKIKALVEADENAYVDISEARLNMLDEDVANYYNDPKKKFEYIGSSKTQRAALKWALGTGLIRTAQFCDRTPDGMWPEKLNGNRVITRLELLDLLQMTSDLFYNGRLPFFETDTVFELPDAYGSHLYAPMYKGIITSKQVATGEDANANCIILDGMTATREDLSRALKNVKIVSKYNCIKLSKYSEKKSSYKYNDALKAAEKLISYADTRDDITCQITNKIDGYSFNIRVKTKQSSFVIYFSTSSKGNDASWNTDSMAFPQSSTIDENRLYITYDALEYDIIKTAINILKKRA